MKEIKSLTGLRGVASLYVMVGHMGFLENKNGIFYKVRPLRFVIDHGYISVDIFFILSGYVMMLMYGKYFENGYSNAFVNFFKKRIARIYPLYVFCFFAYVIVDCFFEHKWFLHNGSSSVIANILLLQTPLSFTSLIPPGWSLSTEWLTYLLFPILCLFISKVRNNYAQFAFLICLFYGLFCIGVPPGWIGAKSIFNCSINVFMGLPAVLRCITGFYIGMHLCKINGSIKNKTFISSSYLQLSIVAIIILSITFAYVDPFNIILFALLIHSLSFDEGIVAKILSHKILYRIGQWSYSVYLIHPLLIGWLKDKLYFGIKRTNFSNYAFLISLTISFSLVILTSYILYKYLELPAKKWIQYRII